ncbi:hypothetical protein [Marichromatium bheemlicum]|uniref:General secretion pathway protein L n=1 Tax=Marichromatium bheemlicum TaxID=365339 RepID=A0ABX1I575_9GAMM|nr:hypothetical protein [Marichromatium bheemlicum]NKN32388.1 hypothetical protein [Marichromatium bheemlicum]
MLVNSRVADIAPIIEKRLRDHGEIDSYSRVIVHQRTRLRDAYRVFYTVVPLDVWTRYQKRAKASDHYQVLVPLGAAMLAWTLKRGRASHLLVLLQPDDISFMVVIDKQVMLAERMPVLAGSDPGMVAERLFRQLNEQGFGRTYPLPPHATLIGHGEFTEDTGAQLVEALRRRFPGIDWTQLPASCTLDHDPDLQSALPTLLETSSEAIADTTPGQRAQLLLLSMLPWLGLSLLVLTLALVWQGTRWNGQALALEQRLAEQRVAIADLDEIETRLRRNHQQSIVTAEQASDVLALLDLQARRDRVPPLPRLVRDVQRSLPEGLELRELSVVVEDGVAMVVLTGRSEAFYPSMEKERHLVDALTQHGYRVIDQTIQAGNSGENTFSLAALWGNAPGVSAGARQEPRP